MDNERIITDISKLTEQIATEKKFEKHGHEFLDPERGPVQDVQSKEDLQNHVYETLVSDKTDCFKVEQGFEKGTVFFYNGETNTYIVVPGQENLEPTVYRPKAFEEKFQDKFDRTFKIQGYEPEIKRGIRELLPELGRAQTREEVTQDFRVASREATTVAERAAGKVGGVIERTGDIITGAIEGAALGIEEFLVGGSRKAPGGAEYVAPTMATPSRQTEPAKSRAQKDQDTLRKTSGTEAVQDPQVQAIMTSNPAQARAELLEAIRRQKEQEIRERKELYRDNDDWEREH